MMSASGFSFDVTFKDKPRLRCAKLRPQTGVVLLNTQRRRKLSLEPFRHTLSHLRRHAGYPFIQLQARILQPLSQTQRTIRIIVEKEKAGG
jgi:transposase InsO family protein